MKKLDSKLKDTRRDFLYKLSTEMSVTTQELFQKLDKFLEWLRIGNYRELFLKKGTRKIRWRSKSNQPLGTHIVRKLYATSLCCCGFQGGKLYLSISGSGNVVHCGAKHCRVGSGPSITLENAAINILSRVGIPRQKTERSVSIRLLPK